jgi:toxin ParE1/3/4
MNVRHSLAALVHIESIEAYVSTRDPAAARRVVARIRAACRQLGDYPKMGHTGLVSGTFEWSVTGLPYIIVYEQAAEADEVIVLAVFHGAQDRENIPILR